MTLHIHKERLISDIQQEFNDAYPYLKIELFATPLKYEHTAPLGGKLPRQLPLRNFAQQMPEGKIHVEETMSVHQLEELFQAVFGLNLQVFRKSGNLWLETTVTDSWTLKQQNEYGRELEEVRMAGGRGR